MTPKQVELLFTAAKTPFLNDEQRSKLSLSNPFSLRGPTAEAIQAEVSRLDPVQARAWIEEAGATMSLQAAAAQQGLVQMTPAIQAEIARLNPRTVEEQNADRIAQLTAERNPYGAPGRYETNEAGESVYVEPIKPNLTACLELESLNAELAAKLKAQAAPAKPAHNFTEREAQILQAHGYALPE